MPNGQIYHNETIQFDYQMVSTIENGHEWRDSKHNRNLLPFERGGTGNARAPTTSIDKKITSA